MMEKLIPTSWPLNGAERRLNASIDEKQDSARALSFLMTYHHLLRSLRVRRVLGPFRTAFPISSTLSSIRTYASAQTEKYKEALQDKNQAELYGSRPHVPIIGTVPPHDVAVFLRSSVHPSEYPSRFSSSVQTSLRNKFKALRCRALVNYAWFLPDGETHLGAHSPLEGDMEPVTGTIFSHKGGMQENVQFSLSNLDEIFPAIVERHIPLASERPLSIFRAEEAASSETAFPRKLIEGDVHIYVCTHGNRNCDCGEVGGRVVSKLRKALLDRLTHDPESPLKRVKIGEVAHVSGH
jgi:hypothetical protein